MEYEFEMQRPLSNHKWGNRKESLEREKEKKKEQRDRETERKIEKQPNKS